jgi:hypothetical protein
MEFYPQHGAWCQHHLHQLFHQDMPVDTILPGKSYHFSQWASGAAFAPKIL